MKASIGWQMAEDSARLAARMREQVCVSSPKTASIVMGQRRCDSQLLALEARCWSRGTDQMLTDVRLEAAAVEIAGWYPWHYGHGKLAFQMVQPQ